MLPTINKCHKQIGYVKIKMINEKNEVIDKNPTTKLKPPLLPAYDDRQVLMVNFRMLPLKQYTCNMLDGFSFWTLIKCL